MTSRERKLARGRGMLRAWSRAYLRDMEPVVRPVSDAEIHPALRASVERARAAQRDAR